MHERIISTADVCFGKPRIRGTRMCVYHVLEYMAGGDTIETMIEYHPYLTREDIQACLAYAAESVSHPVVQIAAE